MKKQIKNTSPLIPNFFNLFPKIFKIFSSQNLTNNAHYHRKFTEKLENYFSSKKVLVISNGHLALEYSLETIEKKGEIITTPFTFSSTTNAIIRKGFKPVFVDINENNYNIDPEKIEALITDETVGIMPVHVYGSPCGNSKIQEIAKKHNLKLIYDAAHAFGVKVDNEDIALMGDISMFSFHATKVFNTLEGGALVFENEKDYLEVSKLINFGITGKGKVEHVGGNAKMDEVRAAIGLSNLKKLNQSIRKRKKAFETYEYYLKDVSGLKLLNRDSIVEYNYAYFPVLVEDFHKSRDEIIEELAKENIEARKYFYPLTSDFQAYQGMFDSSLTPVAQRVAKNILTLPLYVGISHRTIKKICKIIIGRD